MSRLRARLVASLALGVLGGALLSTGALAATWHLDTAFGRHGVAGLPVREHGRGSLLAEGPQGSLYVGGFADHVKGAFLVARMSAAGTLVGSFGKGGVITVPQVYAFPQAPPRLFALPGGSLLVLGLDRADRLVAVRVSARGQLDPRFGHAGVASDQLAGVRGFALVTAATVERNGDVLAVYQREARQPVNEPAIPAGLGEGAIELVRLTPAGTLDGSFGHGGFLAAGGRTPTLAGYPGSGAGWACATAIAPDGSVLLAYEQAVVPGANGTELPAVQELGPTGADAAGFGGGGAVFLPFAPKLQQTTSLLCDGLFALPGDAVEASFGGEGQNSKLDDLFRFTPTGAEEPSFGTAGHTTLHVPVAALAPGGAGETLSAGTSGGALVVGGTLASGLPDPELGGAAGQRFAAGLPQQPSGQQAGTIELLPSASSVTVRVGEQLVRISD